MIDNKRHTNSYKSLVLGIALFLTACSSYDIATVKQTENVSSAYQYSKTDGFN